jgi:Rad3-related DNA helicase
MSGGEHRPEQQEMCRAVAEAIATRTHLVVQAGTGTGKSLAYLVPARSAARRWSWPPRRPPVSEPIRRCPRTNPL